ncbi:uncharacterized protein EI90DRAFT_3048826, partial [Cantharellus anzutake]|uniref:uncharacterized protein n=1 Tax=Cantharellus anzutake TaxID=1750568 RepID=UPI001906D7B6
MVSTALLVTMIEWVYCHVFGTDTPPAEWGPCSIAYLMDPHDAFGYADGDWNQNSLCKWIPDFNPFKAWRCACTTDPLLVMDRGMGNFPHPHNTLAKLSILVFSFVCNSASSERFFSITGDTKDPSQNWLAVKKMVKISAIKLDLNHEHAVEGTHQKCIQQSFGYASANDCGPTGSHLELEHGHLSSIPDDINHSNFSFCTNLLDDLNKDLDIPRLCRNVPVYHDSPHDSQCHASLQGKAICDIFNMTLDGPWNHYWFQGTQNFTLELEMQDFVARDMNLDVG